MSTLLSVLGDVTRPTPIPIPLAGWGPESMSALCLILKHFDIWIPRPIGETSPDFQSNAAYFKPLVLNPVHMISSAPISIVPYFPISTHLNEKLDESIQTWFQLTPEKAAALGILTPSEDKKLAGKLWDFVLFECIIEQQEEWFLNESNRQNVIVLLQLVKEHENIVKELALADTETIVYQQALQQKTIQAIHNAERKINETLDYFLEEPTTMTTHLDVTDANPTPPKAPPEPQTPEIEPQPTPPEVEPDPTPPETPPKPQKPEIDPGPTPPEIKPDPTPPETPPQPDKPEIEPGSLSPPDASTSPKISSGLKKGVLFSAKRPVKKYEVDWALNNLAHRRDILFYELYGKTQTNCPKGVQLVQTINKHPLIKELDQKILFFKQQYAQIEMDDKDNQQAALTTFAKDLNDYIEQKFALDQTEKALQDLRTMLNLTNNNQPEESVTLDALKDKLNETKAQSATSDPTIASARNSRSNKMTP